MFNRILIAVDPNVIDHADALVEAALRIGDRDGATYHVVGVVPDFGKPIVAAALGPEHFERMRREAQAILQDWTARKLPKGSDVHVVQGSVYDAVIRTAKDIAADVIVVGSHRPELKDYLIGPNAARIVRHADQSVIVVR